MNYCWNKQQQYYSGHKHLSPPTMLLMQQSALNFAAERQRNGNEDDVEQHKPCVWTLSRGVTHSCITAGLCVFVSPPAGSPSAPLLQSPLKLDPLSHHAWGNSLITGHLGAKDTNHRPLLSMLLQSTNTERKSGQCLRPATQTVNTFSWLLCNDCNLLGKGQN